MSLQFDEDALDEIVHYHASDSIVYDIKEEALYLYGDAYMDYGDVTVESAVIYYNMSDGALISEGVQDSTGAWVGTPVFTQGGQEYEAHKMEYSFKTKKGKTYDVFTQQDQAYIHSEVVQKNEYDEWYGRETYYTTCDNKDHPHFYIEAKKSKVVPNKVMVTGPANLIVSGINTPIYLPFAIFPTKQGQRSGIITPEFGEQRGAGFFLKGLGYHWQASEKLAMTFNTDIYTRGTFRFGVITDYKKRYKYGGRLNLEYTRTSPTRKFISNEGSGNDYSIFWQHTLDSKAKPNNSFNASVEARSNNFIQNSNIVTAELLQVELTSNVRYSRTFPGKPYSLSIAARMNQNRNTRTIALNAPEVTFNITRFTPFKRKIQSGNKKFYEQIGITLSTAAKSHLTAADSVFFQKETWKEANVGFRHTARIDAPFNLFKHFKMNPSFTYTDRWYLEQENRSWTYDTIYTPIIDPTNDTLISIDTTNGYVTSITDRGFYDVRDFAFSTNLSTTLTGIFNFKGKKLKAIRHQFKPSLTYTFRPDFSDENYGYYDSYFDELTGRTVEYNRYTGVNQGLYGVPGQGLQNIVRFDAINNLDMKVLNKKDTTSTFRNIPLIENIRFSSGYNFSADSLKIQPIIFNINSSLFNKQLSWQVTSTFSPYVKNDALRMIDQTVWESNKRFLQLVNLNFTGSWTILPKSKNKDEDAIYYGTINQRDYFSNNRDAYYDFDIPWSLSFTYNASIVNGTVAEPDKLDLTTNSLTVRGSIQLTRKWDLEVRSGYDFKNMDATFTTVRVERDLHCWVLAFNWTAYPVERQTYSIDLHVRSSVLEALKVSRKKPATIGADFF